MGCPLFFKGCNGFLIILVEKMEMNFEGAGEILYLSGRISKAKGLGYNFTTDNFGLIHLFGQNITWRPKKDFRVNKSSK